MVLKRDLLGLLQAQRLLLDALRVRRTRMRKNEQCDK
jgi:hypothetical protein